MRHALDTQMLNTVDAAQSLGLSPRTLEKYRCVGGGPTFRKLGGRVVYAIADLEGWIAGSACRTTSDPQYQALRTIGRHTNRPIGPVRK